MSKNILNPITWDIDWFDDENYDLDLQTIVNNYSILKASVVSLGTIISDINTLIEAIETRTVFLDSITWHSWSVTLQDNLWVDRVLEFDHWILISIT